MTNRIRKKMLLFNIGIPTENNDNSNLMITNLIEFDHAFFDYIMPLRINLLYKKSIA
jgi:hypothetical protein